MKVSDLIAKLKSFEQSKDVVLIVDGARCSIDGIYTSRAVIIEGESLEDFD